MRLWYNSLTNSSGYCTEIYHFHFRTYTSIVMQSSLDPGSLHQYSQVCMYVYAYTARGSFKKTLSGGRGQTNVWRNRGGCI